MIQVWKLPLGVDIEGMKRLVAQDGCSYLNPIQDVHDNWIISQEEYNYDGFQYLKTEHPDIVANMVLIDYEPKPTPNPFENA